jgi:hypothetical protein
MKAFFALLVASLVASCAYTDVVPVHPEDKSTWGVRVYDVKPLLLVTPAETKIIFVPNYDRAYAVRFGAFLAKNDFKIMVENGALKQLDSNLDSTGIIELLKTVAEKALPALLKTTGGEAQSPPPVALFEFIFDGQGNIAEVRRLALPGRLPAAPKNGDSAPRPKNK